MSRKLFKTRVCQYCVRQAFWYIYAAMINPLDSSVETCKKHVAKGTKDVDVGFGVRKVRLWR